VHLFLLFTFFCSANGICTLSLFLLRICFWSYAYSRCICALIRATSQPDISRARLWFFEGQKKILLYSERSHFFHRYKVITSKRPWGLLMTCSRCHFTRMHLSVCLITLPLICRLEEDIIWLSTHCQGEKISIQRYRLDCYCMQYALRLNLCC
jgi:hypothetical protein